MSKSKELVAGLYREITRLHGDFDGSPSDSRILCSIDNDYVLQTSFDWPVAQTPDHLVKASGAQPDDIMYIKVISRLILEANQKFRFREQGEGTLGFIALLPFSDDFSPRNGLWYGAYSYARTTKSPLEEVYFSEIISQNENDWPVFQGGPPERIPEYNEAETLNNWLANMPPQAAQYYTIAA